MAMFLDYMRAVFHQSYSRIMASFFRQKNDSVRNSPLCETCSSLDIDHIFREDGVDPISIGTLATILSNKDTCGLCHLISHLITRSWCLKYHPNEDLTSVQVQLESGPCGWADINKLPSGGRVGAHPTCAHRIYLSAARPAAVTRMVFDRKINLSLELQMMEESAARFGREPAFHGRRVGPVVSIKRIKEWMRICDEEHGATCANVWRNMIITEQLPQGTKMIDVVQMAVVDAPLQHCRYVALSYVWGRINTDYLTVSKNVTERHLKGSLEDAALPRTIRDAIKLVRELGERYLWVDALCIIQDDADHKEKQIAGMHLIYGMAVVTIFSIGGKSADAPLPGLEPGSRKEHRQCIERIQSLSLAVPLRTLNEILVASVWNTRGWTFQEVILSRRRIFFTKEQVFFQCQRDLFSEDVVAESSTETSRYPGKQCTSIPRFLKADVLKGFIAPTASDNWGFVFQNIIESYTRRLLTDPMDIYNAISAIFTMFFAHVDLNQEFLFGMPMSTLEGALLWQPTLVAPAHARRVLPNKPTPSWSWAGWKGSATYGIDGEHIVGFLEGSATASESLVDEWIVGDMDGRARVFPTARHLQLSYIPLNLKKYSGPPKPSASQVLPVQGADLATGTLLFRTTAAKLRVRRVDLPVDTFVQLEKGRREHYRSKFHSVFEVFLNASTPATMGRVVLPFDTETTEPLEFAVLSRCNVGASSDTFDHRVFGDWYIDCFLNVMVLKKCVPKTVEGVEVSERLGVGVIVEVGWVAAGIQERVICLQ